MRARRAWWVLGVLWAGLLTAAPLHAQQSLIVLGLMSEDGDDELARQLTDQLRSQAAEQPEWAAAPSGPSLSQLTMAFDCDVKRAQCLHSMTANLGMELVLYGTLRREADQVRVRVGLFDVYNERSAGQGEAGFPMDAAPDATRAAAASLVAQLLGREPPAQTPVEVAPAVPPPADTADTADTEAESGREEFVADSPSDARDMRWLAYTLFGVAGVSAAMAVVSWVMIDSAMTEPDFEEYRRAIGSSGTVVEDVCVEADAGRDYGLTASELSTVQDACGQGATWEVLQYVFQGTAIAAGTAGAIILIAGPDGEDDRDRASLSLHPTAGPGGAALRARLRF